MSPFNPKNRVLRSEEIAFPWSALGPIVDEFSAGLLRGLSVVEVMQPVHNSHLVNLPVGLDSSQMCFIQNDQVVQTFPPYASDYSFRVSIEVDDLSSVMGEEDHHVQWLEGDGGNNEEVQGGLSSAICLIRLNREFSTGAGFLI